MKCIIYLFKKNTKRCNPSLYKEFCLHKLMFLDTVGKGFVEKDHRCSRKGEKNAAFF